MDDYRYDKPSSGWSPGNKNAKRRCRYSSTHTQTYLRLWGVCLGRGIWPALEPWHDLSGKRQRFHRHIPSPAFPLNRQKKGTSDEFCGHQQKKGGGGKEGSLLSLTHAAFPVWHLPCRPSGKAANSLAPARRRTAPDPSTPEGAPQSAWRLGRTQGPTQLFPHDIWETMPFKSLGSHTKCSVGASQFHALMHCAAPGVRACATRKQNSA